MQKQIEAILSGVKDKKIEQVGPYWQIRVGSRAGARENGVSLARDLLKEHQEDVAAVPPEPLITPQADELAKLRARIAELEAEKLKPADDIAVPEFLKEPIPHELTDLIDPVDTPVQSNEKLLARLREVLGLIGLAEDAGGRAAPELYRKRDRLESGIRFNRGRMAETL